MARERLRLVVMGFGEHGKDTVCDMISTLFDMSFCTSSMWACEPVVFPVLRDRYGYKTAAECFRDRHNHRDDWFQLISDFNTPDKARLAKKIFSIADVYCGLRCRDEFLAARAAGLFDFAVWVDASARLPDESAGSCTVSRADADFVIDNNTAPSDLYSKVFSMISTLRARKRDARYNVGAA